MSRSMIQRTRIRWLIGTITAAAAISGSAHADVFIDNGYHFQQAPFYCGPGSMEMMLDSPEVISTNANVASGLAIAAAANAGGLTPVVENGRIVNVLPGDLAVQNQLYSGEWGAFTNLAFATGTGSPPGAVAAVMNAVDGPGNGGVHAYANWNFAPNLVAGDLASRTVAATLQNFQVPATVAVENGAHWIDVNGVSTNGAVVANGNYTINGFFVRDPWTGLALTNPGLAAVGGLGLGTQTYLRYGLDNLGNGKFRLAPWFQYFNPTGPRGAPPNAYSIVVEPLGPELPDTFDPNATLSNPSGIPIANILATDLTMSQAAADALSALSNDTDSLDDIAGLTGGTLDTSSLDDMFFTLPGDTSGSGDWLFPYEGTGGACDITGGIAIDEQTGLVDEATSFGSGVCLATLDTWALDQQNGLLPNDNTDQLPEPGSVVLLLSAIGGLQMLRRRRYAARV